MIPFDHQEALVKACITKHLGNAKCQWVDTCIILMPFRDSTDTKGVINYAAI